MKAFALFSLLISCAACTPTTLFQVNMDRQQIPVFTRVLVASELPPNLTYLDDFLVRFPAEYEVCVVDAGPLALASSDSLIRDQARTCKSEVILTIQPYRNYVTGSGQYQYSHSDYVLELKTVATNQTFWKAFASTGGGWQPTARQILRQLLADRVINGDIRRPPIAAR